MKDEEFFAKLLETFRIEADEHLKNISDGLLALEGELPSEQRQEKIELIFREAHSLKGAARAVNQFAIEKICQTLENVLAALKKGKLLPSSDLFDALHASLDVIGAAIISSPDQQTIANITNKLEQILSPPSVPSELASTGDSIFSSNENLKGIKVEAIDEKKEESAEPLTSLEKSSESNPLETQVPATKELFKEKTIRVSLLKMNQIFQEAEEMLMVKLIAQQQVSNLRQLSMKQRIQEKEFAALLSEIQVIRQTYKLEKSPTSIQAAIKKILSFFDDQQKSIKSSREKLNKLIKISEQNIHFVESIVETLLEDMKKILMQPMSTLFEAMPRMIRSISHDLGKEVQVDFQGGEIEIDRRILEELKDPLIHLIRNAIDHGIESPEERKEAHKPSTGSIKLIARESGGNSVILSIIDDGRGMNFNKIKSATVKQGVLSKQETEALTEEEIIKLAFHSGISTSPIVTELSGRGIGLGIVSEKVDRLGGQIAVASKAQQGTQFTLTLPLTLATFRGIHITIAGHDFIMPSHNVKRVIRVKREEIQTIANDETIIVDKHPIPFIYLADLLGLPRKIQKDAPSAHFIFVLLVSSAEKMIAFGTDEIHSEKEVLVKGLGKQCVRVKNIMAATVMESGNVIPILNPIDLIHSAIKGKIIKSINNEIQEGKISSKKEILLAEDSITTRLLLKNILESAGYEVKTAVDGIEALEILRSKPIDLLLTDVEMPRMDGFTLVEKVKEMESAKDLPIVICTSRGSPEDRERGIELGANAYLDKSKFTQQELINILRKLL